MVQHGPGLLKETLACAVPTLVSAEVYAKNLPSLDKRQVEELVRVIPAVHQPTTWPPLWMPD